MLLIDGVDEADGRAGSLDNNVLRLLREHFPKMHPAVHIIVSCRSFSKGDDPLAGLKVCWVSCASCSAAIQVDVSPTQEGVLLRM